MATEAKRRGDGMAYVGWIVVTYLVAAFPFGLLVAQVCCGIDPRQAGSRNTGATNVARLCGTRYGVITLVLDLAKGAVPVLVARAMVRMCSSDSISPCGSSNMPFCPLTSLPTTIPWVISSMGTLTTVSLPPCSATASMACRCPPSLLRRVPWRVGWSGG